MHQFDNNTSTPQSKFFVNKIKLFCFVFWGEENAHNEICVLKFVVNQNGSVETTCNVDHLKLKVPIKTQFPWNEYIVRAGWTKWENR